MIPVLLLVAGFLITLGLGFLAGRYLSIGSGKRQIAELTTQAEALLANAEQKIQSTQEQRLSELTTQWQKKSEKFELETAEIRRKLQKSRQKLDKRHGKAARLKKRLQEREALLIEAASAVELIQREIRTQQDDARQLIDESSDKSTQLEELRRKLTGDQEHVSRLKERLERQTSEYEKRNADHIASLERIAGLSRDDAKKALEDKLIDEVRLQSSAKVKEMRDEARLTANREVRRSSSRRCSGQPPCMRSRIRSLSSISSQMT